MAYYRYTRLQQYINGQPTDTYAKGERVDNVDYSTYETCMGGSGNSRWVSIPQTVCYNGDLWSMEKEQISYDGGTTWADTGNTKRASVIEPSASQCSGADNDWRVVYGEYICNGTTKCLKEAEYIDNSPTGRTRAGSIVELLSEDCGVMYQWVNVPGEYVCVFKCGRGDKYTKQKQQYSLDNGVHWEDTGETREGDFVEKNSADCGCDTSIPRWVTVSGEYVCVGTSKYTKEKEQTSTDGTNWTDTGNTRTGSLIETSSTDCGYIPPHDYSRDYLTTEALGDGSIRLWKGGNGDQPALRNIQYSKNNGSWTAYTYGTNISVNTGDKIRWKATKNVETLTYNFYSGFAATVDYKAYGNPLSLLNNDSFVDEPDALHTYAYYRLFKNSSTLKDVSNLALPATTLAHGCYKEMFYGCTGLTSVPSNLLPATTLDRTCYNMMFYNCTNLTTAPELPATTLADECYMQMFYNCTNLTTAPELPATTLRGWCYNHMFYGCTGLTTAPELPATTLSGKAYQGMFKNCSNLNYIKCLVTSIGGTGDQSLQWVYGVAATGTFVKPSSMTGWTTGDGGIPSGWTIQDA